LLPLLLWATWSACTKLFKLQQALLGLVNPTLPLSVASCRLGIGNARLAGIICCRSANVKDMLLLLVRLLLLLLPLPWLPQLWALLT
jgi:hypothetical protein